MASGDTTAMHSSLDETFSEVAAILQKKYDVRQKIRDVSEEADLVVRRAMRSLATLHSSPSLSAPATAAMPLAAEAGRALKAVEAACPDEAGALREYRNIWEGPLQRAAYVCVLLEFAATNGLASQKRVVAMLGGEVRLPVEDYLWGICNAVGDLPRLAMNRVTLGDYETAKRNAQFAKDVQDAFGRVNFRNDFLRKKFDGLKYDVSKLEQLIYDLSVRGLLKEAAGVEGEAGDTTAAAAAGDGGEKEDAMLQ